MNVTLSFMRLYPKPLEVYGNSSCTCISMDSGSKCPNVSTVVPLKYLQELITCKTSADKFFIYICDHLVLFYCMDLFLV